MAGVSILNTRMHAASGLDTSRDKRGGAAPRVSEDQNPLLIFHIDADNGVVLSTLYSRLQKTEHTKENKDVPCLEACPVRDFASHLLAEFMWGTLDPETGRWIPVSESPSCDPPLNDDSLITCGQFLRSRNTAADPGDLQVCENIRRVLQTFGQDGEKKYLQPQRPKRKPKECTATADAEAEGERENQLDSVRADDLLKEVHTQLMKRMALPLTVRLGLGCETPNPGAILAPVFADSDSARRPSVPSAASSVLSPREPRIPSVDSAEKPRPGLECSATSSLERPSNHDLRRVDEQRGAHASRLKSGFWYTMPYFFHTLFRLIREKTRFKLVFYTRDHAQGCHIRALVQEINALCEGKHPAFDGNNRTKQVFLDGRKKSRDLRISESQIGSLSVSYSTRDSAYESSSSQQHSSERTAPKEAARDSRLPDASLGRDEPRQAAEGAQGSRSQQTCYESPTWTLRFLGSDTQYEGIHEIYTAMVHDLLSRHNVLCLCFGAAPDEPKRSEEILEAREARCNSLPPAVSPRPSGNSVAVRGTSGDDRVPPDSCMFPSRSVKPNTPFEETGKAAARQPASGCELQSAAVNRESITPQTPGCQELEPSPVISATADAASPDTDTATIHSAAPRASPPAHGDDAEPTRAEQGPEARIQRLVASDEMPSSLPCPASDPFRSYSLSEPLVPLPVFVDPADFTRHHVCVGSPAILSVARGLSHVPTLSVFEVVFGTPLFDASAEYPEPVLSAVAPCRRTAKRPNVCGGEGVSIRSGPEGVRVPGGRDASRTSEEQAAEPCGQFGVALDSWVSPGRCMQGKTRAWLAVDPVYSVVIPEPCSLIANPDYICNIVQTLLTRRLRLLSQCLAAAPHALRRRRTPDVLWEPGNAGNDPASSERKEKNRGESTRKDDGDEDSPDHGAVAGRAGGDNGSSVTSGQRPRYLTFLDRFAPLSGDEIKALPTREYLRATVIPVLLPAVEFVLRERPEDPISWIAFYLLRHSTHFNRTDAHRQQLGPESVSLFASLVDANSGTPRDSQLPAQRTGSNPSLHMDRERPPDATR